MDLRTSRREYKFQVSEGMFTTGKEWEGSYDTCVMIGKGKGSISIFESMNLCSIGSGRSFWPAPRSMASRCK